MRIVPHPDKMYAFTMHVLFVFYTLTTNQFTGFAVNSYKINVVALDPTGAVEIILGDREVRTLLGKRARDLQKEVLILFLIQNFYNVLSNVSTLI